MIYRFAIKIGFYIRHRPSICRSVLCTAEINGREKLGNQSGFISLKSCGLLMALYGFHLSFLFLSRKTFPVWKLITNSQLDRCPVPDSSVLVWHQEKHISFDSKIHVVKCERGSLDFGAPLLEDRSLLTTSFYNDKKIGSIDINDNASFCLCRQVWAVPLITV